MAKRANVVRISTDDLVEAIESGDFIGFCLSCGEQSFGVEPDAREYVCESCGEPKVYGAEELLLMGVGE